MRRHEQLSIFSPLPSGATSTLARYTQSSAGQSGQLSDAPFRISSKEFFGGWVNAADLVWRAAGAVAVMTMQGGEAIVIALSYSERGESGELWKEPHQTIENVKLIRHEEANAAAQFDRIALPEMFLFEPRQPELCEFMPKARWDPQEILGADWHSP